MSYLVYPQCQAKAYESISWGNFIGKPSVITATNTRLFLYAITEDGFELVCEQPLFGFVAKVSTCPNLNQDAVLALFTNGRLAVLEYNIVAERFEVLDSRQVLPIHAGGSVASGLFPQETGKALVVTSSQHARIVLLDDRKLVLRDIYDVDGTVSRCTAEGPAGDLDAVDKDMKLSVSYTHNESTLFSDIYRKGEEKDEQSGRVFPQKGGLMVEAHKIIWFDAEIYDGTTLIRLSHSFMASNHSIYFETPPMADDSDEELGVLDVGNDVYAPTFQHRAPITSWCYFKHESSKEEQVLPSADDKLPNRAVDVLYCTLDGKLWRWPLRFDRDVKKPGTGKKTNVGKVSEDTKMKVEGDVVMIQSTKNNTDAMVEKRDEPAVASLNEINNPSDSKDPHDMSNTGVKQVTSHPIAIWPPDSEAPPSVWPLSEPSEPEPSPWPDPITKIAKVLFPGKDDYDGFAIDPVECGHLEESLIEMQVVDNDVSKLLCLTASKGVVILRLDALSGNYTTITHRLHGFGGIQAGVICPSTLSSTADNSLAATTLVNGSSSTNTNTGYERVIAVCGPPLHSSQNSSPRESNDDVPFLWNTTDGPVPRFHVPKNAEFSREVHDIQESAVCAIYPELCPEVVFDTGPGEEGQSITGVWGLKAQTTDIEDSYVVASFLSGTRVLVLSDGVFQDATEMLGIDSTAHTLSVGNMPTPIEFAVQVTPNSVVAFPLPVVVNGSKGGNVVWHSPSGRAISVAAISHGFIMLHCSGSQEFTLLRCCASSSSNADTGNAIEIQQVASVHVGCEISCISPICPDQSTGTAYVACGTYEPALVLIQVSNTAANIIHKVDLSSPDVFFHQPSTGKGSDMAAFHSSALCPTDTEYDASRGGGRRSISLPTSPLAAAAAGLRSQGTPVAESITVNIFNNTMTARSTDGVLQISLLASLRSSELIHTIVTPSEGRGDMGDNSNKWTSVTPASRSLGSLPATLIPITPPNCKPNYNNVATVVAVSSDSTFLIQIRPRKDTSKEPRFDVSPLQLNDVMAATCLTLHGDGFQSLNSADTADDGVASMAVEEIEETKQMDSVKKQLMEFAQLSTGMVPSILLQDELLQQQDKKYAGTGYTASVNNKKVSVEGPEAFLFCCTPSGGFKLISIETGQLLTYSKASLGGQKAVSVLPGPLPGTVLVGGSFFLDSVKLEMDPAGGFSMKTKSGLTLVDINTGLQIAEMLGPTVPFENFTSIVRLPSIGLSDAISHEPHQPTVDHFSLPTRTRMDDDNDDVPSTSSQWGGGVLGQNEQQSKAQSRQRVYYCIGSHVEAPWRDGDDDDDLMEDEPVHCRGRLLIVSYSSGSTSPNDGTNNETVAATLKIESGLELPNGVDAMCIQHPATTAALLGDGNEVRLFVAMGTRLVSFRVRTLVNGRHLLHRTAWVHLNQRAKSLQALPDGSILVTDLTEGVTKYRYTVNPSPVTSEPIESILVDRCDESCRPAIGAMLVPPRNISISNTIAAGTASRNIFDSFSASIGDNGRNNINEEERIITVDASGSVAVLAPQYEIHERNLHQTSIFHTGETAKVFLPGGHHSQRATIIAASGALWHLCPLPEKLSTSLRALQRSLVKHSLTAPIGCGGGSDGTEINNNSYTVLERYEWYRYGQGIHPPWYDRSLDGGVYHHPPPSPPPVDATTTATEPETMEVVHTTAPSTPRDEAATVNGQDTGQKGYILDGEMLAEYLKMPLNVQVELMIAAGLTSNNNISENIQAARGMERTLHDLMVAKTFS